MQKASLTLTDFTFAELFHAEGLLRLDKTFLAQLAEEDPQLYQNLLSYRTETHAFSALEISELLIDVALVLEQFLIQLFKIETAAEIAHLKTIEQNPISVFKKFFVLKRAKKNLLRANELPPFAELNKWLTTELDNFSLTTDDKELSISLLAHQYLAAPDQFADAIEKLSAWCTQALATEDGKKTVADWTSFHIPERIDYDNLVPCHPDPQDALTRLTTDSFRHRDGFKLTDPRMTIREVQDEVNYCIYCHDHDGDFCSKGFPVKKNNPELGLKKNPLGTILTGCPLEEKISEMNLLKKQGATLASLAMVMVDNPMCPATGHRICNDCMKACIYQKQEPVNIPQIETRVLMDVLNLPWGVEIYDLLTRWNPLRQKQWCMKAYNGLKILIAGMGPAGFTLAHHLLLEGFAVVGFDGLKIEPLPPSFFKEPIYQFDALEEALDERMMAGFGGVAEYGITVRWDKNFLKLIYLSLMRKPHFQVFGNTRFGGTVTVEDAWEMGFDHFVVAVGAGLPKALHMPGSLAPGMRQANDFLMALQLGNAAKKSSLTSLQVRLPAVVVGGGLTGVDTATEVQAYYISQVEKILSRYEQLINVYSETEILNQLDVVSIDTLKEFIAHGKSVREERQRAHEQGMQPDFIKLIRQWGGVTIIYRRKMQDSPAYIHNHDELKKALEEGVYYLEALEPAEARLDSFGHVESLVCHRRLKVNDEWEATQEEVRIPAKAILIATGTQPNIAYEFEHRGTFTKQGVQYQHYEDVAGELQIPHGILHCKEPQFGPFTSYHKGHRRVSLIGDTHPVFHGSVVKAIASGMRTYPKILDTLKNHLNQLGDTEEYKRFAHELTDLFQATLIHIERLTSSVIALTVRAPLAAKHFQAGQFYRLQNYETFAPFVKETSLQIEPLALLCANCDPVNGTLKLIVIEKGASSKLCATFSIGEPLALMGPTGVRAKVASGHETVFIMGQQLSIPLLLSYGQALRHAGNKIVYLGAFETPDYLFCQTEIEKIADMIIWVTASPGEKITVNRPQDMSFAGDALACLMQYAKGTLSEEAPAIPLIDIDRIYLVGETDLLRGFQKLRADGLQSYLAVKSPRVFGSVYSTMQCMLKGVCAQCLQWQIDPETGQRTKAVFACSWHDQPLELIDFDNINERQVQNRLQEKLSELWVDHLLKRV